MKTLKKSTYFTQVEDKFVFRISTAFWHLLIGILTISAIVGIAIFLWSVLPSRKDTVKSAAYPEKPTYPPVEKVNLAELNLTQEKEKAVSTAPMEPIQVYTPKDETVVESDPDKPAYDLALAELKKIIPESQWKPGKFEITNAMGWELYHTDQYRKWVSSGSGVEDYLNNIFRICKANKYSEKLKILKSVSNIVKSVPDASKGNSIEYISNAVNSHWKDLKLMDSVCNMIAVSLRTFVLKNSGNAIPEIIRFAFYNPSAAFDFIPFSAKVCDKISDSLRSSVLSVLISSYYNYFNESTAVQEEATNQFMELLPQIKGISISKALQKFYTVYTKKNKERTDNIIQIDRDYSQKVNVIIADSIRQDMENEIIYQEKEKKKSDYKWKSLELIGGGFIAIALLGTILTLLSIQRILKRMELVVESKKGSDTIL